MSSTNLLHVLFRGLLNDFDEEDEDENPDFGEIDSTAFGLNGDLNRLQPNRSASLETDYLGNNGNIELIFKCLITWMDRESDIEDYLDEVQGVIENGMNLLVTDREWLGTATRP